MSTSTAEGTSSSGCFIDTGVFFAAFNRNDEMHGDGAAALVSSMLGWFGRVYTSTYVIDEAVTLTKAKMGGPDAVRLADDIMGSKRIARLDVDEATVRDALATFRDRSDVRGLSFTDCTTLALVERMKVGTLLSFDGGFKPFVPALLGEGYHGSLSKERRDVLAKVAQRLGIRLEEPTAAGRP
ncbi:MAG: PIN domain-containing protein [Nitrososphaerales archaeon]|jgi:predicted nucleic acid-binding protein